jgi:hypothetical protein
VVPIDPPDPPPNPGCATGETVATVVAGADGAWLAEGLVAGVFNVHVEPPEGSQFRAIIYCGFELQEDRENRLTLYLPFGPGPDPMPPLRQ